MTAQEMFEKLGYEIDTTHYEYERHIVYHNSTAIIDFDLERTNVYKYNQSGFRSPIDMQVLKAINQQCKELGWL